MQPWNAPETANLRDYGNRFRDRLLVGVDVHAFGLFMLVLSFSFNLLHSLIISFLRIMSRFFLLRIFLRQHVDASVVTPSAFPCNFLQTCSPIYFQCTGDTRALSAVIMLACLLVVKAQCLFICYIFI